MGVRWTRPLLTCAASRWRFGGFVLIRRLSLLFPVEILGLRRRWHLRNPGRRRLVSPWPAACSAATSGRTAPPPISALPSEVNSLLLSRKSWGLEELAEGNAKRTSANTEKGETMKETMDLFPQNAGFGLEATLKEAPDARSIEKG